MTESKLNPCAWVLAGVVAVLMGVLEGLKPGTLETLVKDPASAPRHKHLVDKDGKWVVGVCADWHNDSEAGLRGNRW